MRAACIALALAGCAAVVTPGVAQAEDVTVMTRNIYLGSELRSLFETIGAKSLSSPQYQLASTGGQIFRRLRSTNFPVRAKGLAEEVQGRAPDVVGLQEVALWRKGPVDFAAAMRQEPRAEEVYQDFLSILLDEINKGPVKYRVLDVADQRDFEVPADVDDNPTTGTSGADMNLRLTLRNAMLVRDSAEVETKDVRNGHYRVKNSLVTYFPGGVRVVSLRGWQAAKVKVGSGRWFTFANTHLEALDSRAEVPSIRSLQAREFATIMGRVRGPAIEVGDFNSDSPPYRSGEEQAYKVLVRKGFKDIGTRTPWSCCISSSDDLTGGSKREFNHRTDQVFTSTPAMVKRTKVWVVGRKQSFGYWHSDHAGIVVRVRIR
jgi:endonuclease/exonuclease/phosphatase family metal-dependent hydrolase